MDRAWQRLSDFGRELKGTRYLPHVAWFNASSLRTPIKRVVIWTSAFLLLALALRAAWILAHVLWWRGHDVESTAFMRSRLSELQERKASAALAHKTVPWQAISSDLKRAVIVAEDARFRHHFGFDTEGLSSAVEKNVRAGKIVMGGSTITQQLAKNLFLSPRRSFLRKGEEALIALALELLWNKRRILEVYLNVIEWGNGVFGCEAAARHYFGVSAAAVSPDQAAELAAMIPSPRTADARREDPARASRAARIRSHMDAIALP